MHNLTEHQIAQQECGENSTMGVWRKSGLDKCNVTHHCSWFCLFLNVAYTTTVNTQPFKFPGNQLMTMFICCQMHLFSLEMTATFLPLAVLCSTLEPVPHSSLTSFETSLHFIIPNRRDKLQESLPYTCICVKECLWQKRENNPSSFFSTANTRNTPDTTTDCTPLSVANNNYTQALAGILELSL